MAIDVVFPLYEILVESIFGSLGLAIIGIAVILSLILMITRTSLLFLFYWVIIFYGVTMFTFYFGILGLVLAFIIGGLLVAYNILKLSSERG